MSFKPVQLVRVYYQPDGNKFLVGRLALKDRRLFFEYDSSFLKKNLNLSPFALPLQPGVIAADNHQFEGLFGVFNDSLPDGWGRLLLDRSLRKRGVNPGVLTPLDRLCCVGQSGMGALCYEPEIGLDDVRGSIDLDEIAEEIYHVDQNDDDRYVEELLGLGGSSCGARPKIMLSEKGSNWLVKFRSSLDPKDMGQIEYAYHLMAAEAGLEVPREKLFPSKKGGGYFGVQRFDRERNKRMHMHTVGGLLSSDHRIPSLDYQQIMQATLHLTRDIRECEKQLRCCVFNVLSHNRDDHAKNFSFLMEQTGVWRVSPAYDLTFSSGPGGEHCSTIMGEGKSPTQLHLKKLALSVGIKKEIALSVIEEVSTATDKWNYFAEEAGVSSSSKGMIQKALNEVQQAL